MRLLVIAPSGAVAAALDSLQIRSDDHVDVVTATSCDAQGSSVAQIELGPSALPSRGRMATALQRSVIGRNILRLTPLDGGRRFAKAARRNRDFQTSTAEADLIVALERDGILTAWKALRASARPGVRGVHGLAPARALLAAGR